MAPVNPTGATRTPVLIAGYENDPLVDRAALVHDALFWPTYLASSAGPEDDTLVDDAFGADRVEMTDYYRTLTDPQRWPVFRIGLRDGYELDVIYRNLVEDEGVDFVLRRPGGAGALQLATLEGHFHGPGLSWPELAAVATSPYPIADEAGGIMSPDARLLLLLPAVGDGNLPASAVSTLTAALQSVGASASAAGESGVPAARSLAESLLADHPMWDLPTWREGGDGALGCDGQWSRRNPTAPGAFSQAEALEISSALSAL